MANILHLYHFKLYELISVLGSTICSIFLKFSDIFTLLLEIYAF